MRHKRKIPHPIFSQSSNNPQERRIEYLIALAQQLEEQKYIDEAIEAYHRLLL